VKGDRPCPLPLVEDGRKLSGLEGKGEWVGRDKNGISSNA